MFIYHYHAMVQQADGVISHLDGIYDTNFEILSYEKYEFIKRIICEGSNLQPDKLTICSLTLLGIK